MKAAQGYVRVGCPGSENPQMCLNCKRSMCILDMKPESKTRGKLIKMPDEQKVAFGIRLRLLRKSRGLSIAKLAEMVNRVPSAVKAWESGHTSPTAPAMEKLIEIFGGEL